MCLINYFFNIGIFELGILKLLLLIVLFFFHKYLRISLIFLFLFSIYFLLGTLYLVILDYFQEKQGFIMRFFFNIFRNVVYKGFPINSMQFFGKPREIEILHKRTMNQKDMLKEIFNRNSTNIIMFFDSLGNIFKLFMLEMTNFSILSLYLMTVCNVKCYDDKKKERKKLCEKFFVKNFREYIYFFR